MNAKAVDQNGISNDEILLGTIGDDGLPSGEIVTIPVVTTVIGMMAAVNDGGGLYGRQVTVNNCDSAGDLTKFRSCFRELVQQDEIFAFITSITWGTGEVHRDLARNKIPWLGSWGFFVSEWTDPWMFPSHMASIHEAHSNSQWVRDVIKPKSVAIMTLNTPEGEGTLKAMHQIFDKTDIEVVHEYTTGPDDVDQGGNVLAVKNSGAEHFIHFAWSPPAVTWMIAAEQQGYWPPLGVTGNHFAAEALGQFVGRWPLKGLWTITSFKVWSDNSEYLATMEKYAPEMKTKIHHITQSAYAASRIFIDTVKSLGPDGLGRKAIMDAWESHPWDAGPGMGVEFNWGPAGKARAKGKTTKAHDNNRCEYQFKYNQPEAGDQVVWVPAPEGYEICDTFD